MQLACVQTSSSATKGSSLDGLQEEEVDPTLLLLFLSCFLPLTGSLCLKKNETAAPMFRRVVFEASVARQLNAKFWKCVYGVGAEIRE